jgi:predicted acetylornithine/succinylornithine family transaminase
MEDWKKVESKLIFHTTIRTPLVLVKGKGIYVWDEEGNKYIDFVAGWAVDCLGHCHPVLVDALKKQADTLIQTSNQFYTVPQLKLARLLIDESCFDRAFFCNSGAEANEGAVKLARRYGKLNLNGAYEVITAFNSFHGRTLAMTAATGQKKFQEPYSPLPVGFVNVEYDNIDAVKNATTDNTCAVLIELVQGEGGVNIPDKNYIFELRKWCDEKGILLIFDEVQTGMGRIGSIFGYQRFSIEPDIATLAKGLGGGLPIGAILAKEHASVFIPGDHNATFGGNPLVCTGSYAVVDYIIKNRIPEKVVELGQYFIDRLNEMKSRYSFIKGVRGEGLLIGLIFEKEISGKILMKCLQEGLLVNAVKPDMIRFMPPLIIEKKHIDDAINMLEKVFSEWS